MAADNRTGKPHLFSYWVVFHEHLVHPTHDDGPLVDISRISELGQFATRPHVLDRNMVPALRVLWHVLHLPRSSLDYVDLSASELAMAGDQDVSSNIVVVPFSAAIGEKLEGQRMRRSADLVFFDEALDNEELRKAFPASLGLYPFSRACAENLEAQWNVLGTRVAERFRQNCAPPVFVPQGSAAMTLLAYLLDRSMPVMTLTNLQITG